MFATAIKSLALATALLVSAAAVNLDMPAGGYRKEDSAECR